MSATEVFLLESQIELCTNYPLCDDGRAVGGWKGPKAWECEHATSMLDLEDPDAPIELYDCIPVGVNFVVSGKFKGVLDRVTVGDSVGLLPVTLLDARKNPISEYFLLYSRDWCDVLDKERADIEYYENVPSLIYQVRQWVVSAARLPDADIFFCEAFRWLVTARFRWLAEAESIDGIEFREVEVS